MKEDTAPDNIAKYLLYPCLTALLLQAMCIAPPVSASSGNSTAIAQTGNATTSVPTLAQLFWADHRDILPWDYAYVYADPAPVFSTPYCDLDCKPPTDSLSGGFIWVSMEPGGPITASENRWYKTGEKRYMLAQDLRPGTPSIFSGMEFSDAFPAPDSGTSGWLILDTVTSATPGKVEYIDGQLFEKHTKVNLLEKRHIDGWDWYRIGDDQWVIQRRLAIITYGKRPENIGENEKWIEINLYEQTLIAYEGDRPVYATIISSGLPGEDFETPQGMFRIWIKKKFAKMSGGEPGEDYYFLEDVPYHMYFDKSYAIHGAYWHDNFGLRQSHGCVNTSPRDAKWLFDWTMPAARDDLWTKASPGAGGTWVWIHE
jgi:hypothetical protein